MVRFLAFVGLILALVTIGLDLWAGDYHGAIWAFSTGAWCVVCLILLSQGRISANSRETNFWDLQKPYDGKSLCDTWPGEVDDGFEEAINELRHTRNNWG